MNQEHFGRGASVFLYVDPLADELGSIISDQPVLYLLDQTGASQPSLSVAASCMLCWCLAPPTPLTLHTGQCDYHWPIPPIC